MLAYLRGVILYHGVGYVIVEQGGTGYKVFVPESWAHELRSEVSLFTHEVIRNDTRELFGFPSIEALELFWKLINVSGVGPKSAQKIVLIDQIERVKNKITEGDIGFLTDVPGIGKKTAQKIILELKGVLADEPQFGLDREAVDALMSLGYSRKDADRALTEIEAETTEERIRVALKKLGKQK